MPSETQGFFQVTAAWTDLVDENAALDSVDVSLVFRGATAGAEVELVAGGAAEPDDETVAGILLHDGDAVTVNSDHLWVRTIDRGGKIVPTVL